MNGFVNRSFLEADKPLSREEEEILFERYKHYGDKRAKEKLFRSNIRFVVKMALKYKIHKYSHLEYSDLINEGIMGLLRAMEMFNPSRHLKFISYAVWWIRSYQDKAFYDSFFIRLPQTRKVNSKKYTRKEIDYNIISVDSNIPQTDIKIVDTLKDSNEFNVDKNRFMKSKIDQRLMALNEKESKVITRFFGINQDFSYSLKDIGDQLQVSRERIRQIKDEALKKMKKRHDFLEKMEVLS